VNPHDLADVFAARRTVQAAVDDRRDGFIEGRAEIGLAVVQTRRAPFGASPRRRCTPAARPR
jgi:hypothetical protein